MAAFKTRLGVSEALWDQNETFVDFLRFQELTLSPRVIHFSPNEVVWQCLSKSGCESDPNKIWRMFRARYVPILATSKPEAKVSRDEWHDIVYKYSIKVLTFTKDRLPAIAAIATRAWRSRPQDRYIAGLWRSSLCEDLMWSRLGGTVGDVNVAIEQRVAFLTNSASRVPSWSWASTQDVVSWGIWSTTVLSCVKVLDVAYSINGPDVSGEILNAEITLRAPIVSLDCIREYWDFRNAVELNPTDFGLEMTRASHESQLEIADGSLYNGVTLDNYGTVCGPLDGRDLFAVFLVAEDDSKQRELETIPGPREQALLVKEIEPGKRWIRLGVVNLRSLQYELESLLWDGNHDMPNWNERAEEHQKRYRTMLEAAETQVITLV
jgi:hypothetical protein